MSQPRASRTRSRRASSEKDTENSSEDILPATVVEAVRKSSRGRILKETSKVSARMKARNDRETEKEKTDQSDDSGDGDNTKSSNSSAVVEPNGQPLVLDDLIDDFGDDELEDCESSGEATQADEDIGDDEDSSHLVLELADDSDEEVANEIAEEMINFEPSSGNKSSTCKQWKYGKLWEFVRDLLQIEKYNPSVIRWENVEEGEFRIVDSVMVSQLWATVRGNKRMNFEKLSRAMRYYYKYKIFEIAPNKRLVYKFGSRATGWKPRSTGNADTAGKNDPAFIGPNHRCSKCLRLLETPEATQAHMETCTDEIILPEDISKTDADKLRSHILSRSIPDTDTSKPLRQKLSELKSKPLLDVPPENQVSTPTHTDDDLAQDVFQNTEQNLAEAGKESFISSLQTKTSSEQLALESLMSLGEERTSEKVDQSVAEPSFIPLTVTEIFKQPSKMLERTISCPSQEEESAVSLHIPEENESESVARSYIVIPSFEAAVKRPEVVSPPKVMSNIKDKISFLKSAAEKSKTQTILQKRPGRLNTNQNVDDDSDDEIEIVKIIKTPAEERPNPFQSAAPSGSARSTMNNENNIKTNMSFQNMCADPNELISSNSNSISPNLDHVVNKASYSGDQQAGGQRKIVINEKYLNMAKQNNAGGNKIISINPKYMNVQTAPNDARKQIKINEKYLKFVTNPSSSNPTPQLTETQNNMSPIQDIQVLNSQNQALEKETIEIVGPSVTGPNLSSNFQERKIRINSKYSNFMAGRTPAECENIASNDEEASTSIRNSKAIESVSRIKINEKYANFISKPDENMDIQRIAVNQASPVPQNFTSFNERIRDTYQAVSNGPPNKTSTSASTLTSKLRNTKISDIRAQRAEESQNVPLDLSSLNHPSLKRKESINDDYTKRPKLDENIRRSSDTTNCSPTEVSQNSPNPFARRHSDNYGESSFMQTTVGYKPRNDTEPLSGLWKFLRSLLHNPRYNPKLVTWEILEDGMFRIHSLQDFYALWKNLKGSPINYELLSKTLKVYDEKKLLHGVSKHRCVYKFGVNAEDWRPYEGEISRAGKRPVPNQATWPQSRFYDESNTMASLVQPTTLFTLTPLDKGATELSEMKVLSDNSRIVKTNDFLANTGVFNLPDSEKEKPASGQKSITTVIKNEFDNNEEVKQNIDNIQVSGQMQDKSENDGLEIACNLTLPKSKYEKAVLKFDGGFCLELDRSLFKSFETTVKKDMSIFVKKPKIRTTIIHKDKSNPFKFKRKKILKKKFAKKIKPPVDGPLTASQLMDVVVPKKLNFLKSPILQLPEKGPKKLNFILPKPGPEIHVSNNEDETKTTSAATITQNTTENPQFILQPMYTLSYQPMSSESNGAPLTTSASTMSNVVSLHLSEPSTSSTTSNVFGQAVHEEKSSAVRHKLPLVVAQRPSSYTTSRQISPRKDTNHQEQNNSLSGSGYSKQSSVFSVTDENPNVIRCRNYRVRKRIMMKKGEKELDYLTRVNNDLTEREDYLDYTVKTLQQFFIKMIKDNKYDCCQEK